MTAGDSLTAHSCALNAHTPHDLPVRSDGPPSLSSAPPARSARAGGVSARSAAGGAAGADPLGTSTGKSSRACQRWYALRRECHEKRDPKDPAQRQASRDEARAERWALRRAYRKLTKNSRVQMCGRAGARPDGSVVLRVTDATGTAAQAHTGATGRVAGFGGIFHCGNVWLCQECARRVAAERASELQAVLTHYLCRGGWAVLVTLTMRHHRYHGLEQCRAAVSKGWKAVTSGGAWQADKEITDYAGFCRSLEVTESPVNGWHVHVHAVLVFNSRPDRDTLEQVTDGMFRRWSAAVMRAGMPAPTEDYGLDVQHLDLDAAPAQLAEQSRTWARYITKGIAQETLLGVAKEARGTNRSIRQLMRDALVPQAWEDPVSHEIVHTVDLTARKRLKEYERVMSGARQVTWSQREHNIRKIAGLGEDRSDEEIARDELEGEDVAVLPSDSWRTVEPRATELLSVTEREGPDGARRWLDQLGVEWWRPSGLTKTDRRGERRGGATRDEAREDLLRPVREREPARLPRGTDVSVETVPTTADRVQALIAWQGARARGVAWVGPVPL